MLNYILPTDTNTLIQSLINYHQMHMLPHYSKLNNYYLGKHDILNRTVTDGKANNTIANPYPAFIVNVVQGYLLGQPVKYVSENQALLDDLIDILNQNTEEDQNIELCKSVSITGEAFEYVYFDEQANISFVQLPNEQTIAIYDDSLKPKLNLVLRYYYTESLNNINTRTCHVELYWPDRVEYYTEAAPNKFNLDKSIPHFFKQVPVIHYLNNKEVTGDFEKILPLIDDYDRRISDNSNELEYFRNAYLVLKNVMGTDDEDLKKFRETGAFLVEGEGDVHFITKDINLQAVQDHLDTLDKNIHKFANIPNLTDKEFSNNASGVALKYKLWGFENLISAKERKFAKGLYKRIELIISALNLKGKNYNWQDINIKFNRNLPQNTKEIADMVAELKDIVPSEELLAQLPFIEDPQKAAKELQASQQQIVAQQSKIKNYGEHDD